MIPILSANQFVYKNNDILQIIKSESKNIISIYTPNGFYYNDAIAQIDTPTYDISITNNNSTYTINNPYGKCQFILTITGTININNTGNCIIFVNDVRNDNIVTISDSNVVIITDSTIEYTTESATVSGICMAFN